MHGISNTAATDAAATYTKPAIALHWLIAVLIVGAFALGWIMTDMSISPLKLRMFNWHKWVGITVLALVVVRTIWRLTHPAPLFLPMPAWQKVAAHGLHFVLYVLMFLQPLSGWVYSNAAGYPIVYFGVIHLPTLVAKDKALADVMRERHELIGWLLLACIVLHVLAGLKHQFIDRDGTLRRMLFQR
jgi:cytochrome b561